MIKSQLLHNFILFNKMPQKKLNLYFYVLKHFPENFNEIFINYLY